MGGIQATDSVQADPIRLLSEIGSVGSLVGTRCEEIEICRANMPALDVKFITNAIEQ